MSCAAKSAVGRPLDAEFIDPAALVSRLGEARVVAIGETTHYSHEFYALRNELCRLLIEEGGATAVAWESGFAEAMRADEWVHGGPGDIEEILAAGFTSSFGRCAEMRDQLEWIRAWNVGRERPVNVYGLDLPGSLGSVAPALDAAAAYLDRVEPVLGEAARRLGDLARDFGDPPRTDVETRESLRRYGESAASTRNELTAGIADLAAHLDALHLDLVDRDGDYACGRARWNLHQAARLDSVMRDSVASGPMAPAANVRDLAMAETVEWMLRRESRLIAFAHNVHVQRAPFAAPWLNADGDLTPTRSMGEFLASTLGEEYVAIGTTCGGGEALTIEAAEDGGPGSVRERLAVLDPVDEDTVDGLLSALSPGPGIIDLRDLSAGDAGRFDRAEWMRCLSHRIKVPVRQAFDLLAHVPRLTLWHSDATPDLLPERGVG